MKKIIVALMCVILTLSAAGCGKKAQNGGKSDEPQTQTQTQTQDGSAESSPANDGEADKANESANADNASDGNTDAQSGGEAPKIESSEQLEGMVDEFNTTEDPERKEELRKQLEAILAEAEKNAPAGN